MNEQRRKEKRNEKNSQWVACLYDDDEKPTSRAQGLKVMEFVCVYMCPDSRRTSNPSLKILGTEQSSSSCLNTLASYPLKDFISKKSYFTRQITKSTDR